ncbi:FecR family protein [Rufibacter sp. XAAS-G3-1]|uniref:FecR family protein n=1 Tax=Rufibacter sp. XAAS-G3-1 TaxID=2729134 RepID=UPI0015E6DD07|nr:FecR domain-containing protein [Rufibacter sp. XAAS-G3-1]
MLVSSQISVEELVCLETFQHYCLGVNMADQLFWEDWIKANPARAEDIEEARKLIYLLSARQGNRLEQLSQLRAGILQSEHFKQLLGQPAQRNRGEKENRIAPTTHFFRYAVGLAASLAVVVLAYLFFFKPAPSLLAQQPFPSKENLRIQAGTASRKTVVLADGSVVTLRQSSTLTLQPAFNQKNREVWLTGEAFFDVRHDPARPFVVHALFTQVKVLGTVFNLRAHAGDTATETSLLTGRVEVSSAAQPGKPVILKPNQKLISSLSGNPSQKTSAVSFNVLPLTSAKTNPQETAWARTRLDIDNEPLSQIAQKLETWYGINIEFTDQEVKEYRYSGVFENENVVRALEALQLSYPFSFKVMQDKIMISK